MGGRSPKPGATLHRQNCKSSSGENDCRTAMYTVEEVVAKQSAGLLSRVADDGKREMYQINKIQN